MLNKKNRKKLYLIILCSLFVFNCSTEGEKKPDQKNLPQFGNRMDLGVVEDDRITEASGLVFSSKNPGVLWTLNDKGDQNLIFAISSRGKKLGAFHLFGIENRDWEDMAIGPGPITGTSYLYIGDIGDNSEEYDLKFIYRVPEPEVDSSKFMQNRILYDIETIKIKYPTGKFNAETLLLDPLTKDLYVFTKQDSFASIYYTGYPQSVSEIITLEAKYSIYLGGIVGGDISQDGTEIILKSLDKVYYWQRAANGELWESFKHTPLNLPYSVEPQGEAICWNIKSAGYFTLSEELNGVPAHLYYYPRLKANKLRKKDPTHNLILDF